MNLTGAKRSCFGLFLVIILLFVPIYGKSSKNVVVTLYEVDERNSVQKVLESNPNTDVVLEGIKRIRLECSAPFPVQWIYTGNGVPVLSSTIKKESDQKFTASAFITSLKETHTGKYDCITTEAFQLASAYFFLYVPGPNIFTAIDGSNIEGKREIYIPKNDSRILIPCAVSNPKIQVVLEKSTGDVLVSIKSNGKTIVYTFDPKTGFLLDTRQIKNSEGTYVCSAFEKGVMKTIDFEVSFPKGGISDLIMTTEEPIGDKDGFVRCSTHTDCPPNWSCYTDLVCRDPCLNSIRCGTEAVCKYNDRRPYCECPRDFTGDPMKECFNTLQGSDPGIQNNPRQPEQPSTAKSPMGNQCKVNEHCRPTHVCLNGNCVDACAVKICDRNAYCITDANRVAMCLCNPGFLSENGRDCFPVKFQVESPKGKEESADARMANTASLISSPCVHNRDCPGNTICRTNSPVHAASCVEFCGLHLCGENAVCEDGFCRCRSNFSGDPFVICSADGKNASPPPNTKENSDCQIDNDCPATKKCQSFNTYRKCIGACVATQCPYNTECQPRGHTPICVCPKGYTGSALLGCTKDVETSMPTRQLHVPENLRIGERLEGTTQSLTATTNCSKAGLNCGPNAECRIMNGDPTCFCQSNFIGEPPKCKQECASNVDCPQGKACLQNKCRNACRNKCGQNTRCEVSSGPSRTHNCSCREGFVGNPESITGCFPIRDHK